MTLGELFFKVGFKPDESQLKNIQTRVTSAVSAVSSRTGMFQKAGGMIADGMKKAAGGVQTFFSSIKAGMTKAGDFIGDLRNIHYQILAVGTAITMVTKRASDYATELLRVNSVTGISTKALQSLQQQAALSGVEADEVNSSLKNLQQQALDISMGQGNIKAWAMLGIEPGQDPIKVLDALSKRLKTMNPAMGAKFANELGLSDRMIMFLKEAQSLGSSDKSLLLSDKEVRKLKDFNVYFNRAWDASKRALQRLGVTLIPVATFIVDSFQKMVRAGKDIGDFFQWFSVNFKGITKALLIFAGIVGVTLFPLTAGFLALAVAIEDVVGWVRGDKSFIGGIIGPFKEWEGTIQNIINGLKTMKELLTLEGMKDLIKGMGIVASESLSDVIGTKPLGQSNIDKYREQDAKKGTFWQQITGTVPKNDVTVNVYGAPGQSEKEVAKETVKQINSNTMYQQPVNQVK